MQFHKKTSGAKYGSSIKLLIKILGLFLILLFSVVLIDKIDFPYPNKKIEKIISNENFKVVK